MSTIAKVHLVDSVPVPPNDNEDASFQLAVKGEHTSKCSPKNPGGRPRLNERRRQASEIAAHVISDAAADLGGEIARRNGVGLQTVEKWRKGELAMTLRDVIASGSLFAERVGRALKAVAVSRRTELLGKKVDPQGKAAEAVQEAARLFADIRKRLEDGRITDEELAETRQQIQCFVSTAESILDDCAAIHERRYGMSE